MTPTPLVRARVQVRMVDDCGRVLRMSRFMDLVYDPAAPFEVRLADPGGSELVFPRQLLETVLRDGRAGEDGGCRLHLAFQAGSPLLFLTRQGACPFAVKPASVAAFLTRTRGCVHLNIDEELQQLLGRTA